MAEHYIQSGNVFVSINLTTDYIRAETAADISYQPPPPSPHLTLGMGRSNLLATFTARDLITFLQVILVRYTHKFHTVLDRESSRFTFILLIFR